LRRLQILLSLVLGAAPPLFGASFDHSLWGRILKTYVNEIGSRSRSKSAYERELVKPTIF